MKDLNKMEENEVLGMFHSLGKARKLNKTFGKLKVLVAVKFGKSSNYAKQYG